MFTTSTNLSYDSLGNVTGYTNVMPKLILTWTRGRLLEKISDYFGRQIAAYKYDENGIRYSKTANGITSQYYLDGTKIIAEKRGNDLIEYFYDSTGVIGMKYNNIHYLFRRDALNNIAEIFNSDGTSVASYAYDAWGNGKVLNPNGTVNTTETFIGNINPFRYRSYYYDTETGFYYLQTRYYNPQLRRFISADNYELVPQLSQNIGELNMYAYCNNNPIMYTDESGEFIFMAILITAVIIGATAGGVYFGRKAYYNAVENGHTGYLYSQPAVLFAYQNPRYGLCALRRLSALLVATP